MIANLAAIGVLLAIHARGASRASAPPLTWRCRSGSARCARSSRRSRLRATGEPLVVGGPPALADALRARARQRGGEAATPCAIDAAFGGRCQRCSCYVPPSTATEDDERRS